ncbi:MAG: peptidoglycan DD-metalloendopeptidase family protein [Tissierellia bacterium]|nr:peptidoglycan DD-metalloendopeptidase family protein [Tissierellia bacterium]
MEKKNNSKISIMIVPHTEKVRRISFPSWVPKAIIIALTALFMTIVITVKHISSSNTNLKQEYDNKVSEITNLEIENKNKEIELSKLKSQTKNLYEKTNEVEDKLKEIDKLQKKLEKMAAIKSPSRSGNVSRNIKLETLQPDEEMEVLTEVLEDKKLELEIFIKDLEERFEYLECVPDLWPAKGKLTSGFGNRKDPLGWGSRFHQGIDIANSSGTNILAAGKGVVAFSGNRNGYGKTIIVNHGNGYKTLYAHNRKLLIHVGDRVEKGQVIGKMGSTGKSTGCHLHFEIHKNGNPINPLEVLK